MDSKDDDFWCELVGQLLGIVDLIERKKLRRCPTTAECRRTGKELLDGKKKP